MQKKKKVAYQQNIFDRNERNYQYETRVFDNRVLSR